MSTTPQQDTVEQLTPRKPRRSKGIVVLAAVAIVVLLLVVSEGRREISRWHQADAQEKVLDGDLEEAIKSLDTALEWDDAVEIYLMRAQVKLLKEDFEGCVDDCDVVIRRTQAGPVAKEIVATRLRSQAHLEMGNYAEAVKDQKSVGDLLKYDSSLMKRSTYLNGLSYCRALGGIELEEAAKDADKAIGLLGSDGQVTTALLRAWISSDWDPASPMTNEVVGYLKRQLERQTDQTKQQVYDEIAESFPPSNRSTAKMSRLAERHLDASEQLWLLDQRRLTGVATDGGNESSKDDEALKTALEELPTLELSHAILGEFAPILDTRGFVSYKLAVAGETDKRAERLEAGRKDLDLAVVSMEARIQIERTLVTPYQEIDVRSARAGLKRAQQSLAVIRYHRALLLDELGEDQLAGRDRSRVKQLGYEPNERLR